ncbi:MAG: hypothetical protein RBG13Loki_4310, partial [Promethearchaeota archaeon CR_4]
MRTDLTRKRTSAKYQKIILFSSFLLIFITLLPLSMLAPDE